MSVDKNVRYLIRTNHTTIIFYEYWVENNGYVKQNSKNIIL